MGQWAEWRGQRDTQSRRLWTWLVVSSILHAPFTPIVTLLALIGLFDPNRPRDLGPPAPPITEIPVDLLESEGAEPAQKTVEPAPAEPAAAPAEPAIPVPAAPKKLASSTARDAGSEDAADAEEGATGDDGGQESAEHDAAPMAAESEGGLRASASSEAGSAQDVGDAGDGGRGQGSAEGIGDPVALSGSAGKIANAHANIRLILYTEHMRKHPLGSRVGAILGQAYQWRDFFGPSGLDPVADVDRILIAGPELRDSSEVVAVMHYNVSEDRIRSAIDALVRRDGAGEWLDAGAPAARARADRAPRLFVMPAPHLVVVTPPSAAKHALSLSPKTRFPGTSGDEVLTAFVSKPSVALRALPVRFPESIKWLRLKLVPGPDGGSVVQLLARDDSAELAEHNAQMLEGAINALAHLDLGLFGVLLGQRQANFVETVRFSSHGKDIHGELGITAHQMASIVDLLGRVMGAVSARPPPLPQPSPEGSDASPNVPSPAPPSEPAPPPIP